MITGPTARIGSLEHSGFQQLTRPATPGRSSRPPIRITWITPGGYCMPSPTAPDGKQLLTRPGKERTRLAPTLRSGRRRRDERDGS